MTRETIIAIVATSTMWAATVSAQSAPTEAPTDLPPESAATSPAADCPACPRCEECEECEVDEPSYAIPADNDDDEGNDIREYRRFEITMGFVGGWERHSEVGLAGTPVIDAAAFDEGPAASLGVAGLRYDLRLVLAFMRMTIGVDVLFGLFDSDVQRMTTLADGTSVALLDRNFFSWTLRFGIGAEFAVGDIRLFGDVLGVVNFPELESNVGDATATYDAIAFSPGLRLGVRIPVLEWFFVQLEADGAFVGPWAAHGALSVGGAIDSD